MSDDTAVPTLEQLLAFEREHPAQTGAKTVAIRETFALTPGRYYQALAVALDTREAVEADPILVRHLTDRMYAYRARRSFLLGRRQR